MLSSPQFRCAPAGIESNFSHGSRDRSPHEDAPWYDPTAQYMSRPTEDGIARSDALLDESSSERDVVKASAWRPELGSHHLEVGASSSSTPIRWCQGVCL